MRQTMRVMPSTSNHAPHIVETAAPCCTTPASRWRSNGCRHSCWRWPVEVCHSLGLFFREGGWRWYSLIERHAHFLSLFDAQLATTHTIALLSLYVGMMNVGLYLMLSLITSRHAREEVIVVWKFFLTVMNTIFFIRHWQRHYCLLLLQQCIVSQEYYCRCMLFGSWRQINRPWFNFAISIWELSKRIETKRNQ